jgi:diphthamide synthase (EF-2-diphthine--ammonia ligase)
MSALALSWSGGKDSALALWTLREEESVNPAALLSTVTEEYERVSMHGVRRSLLRRQAAATGLPLVEIEIPAGCTVAFGDLFLEDIRAYRESRLARADRRARFPVWGADTAALARRFVAAGFGENGEFYTFVTVGLVLAQPVACCRGEVVERDGFVFCDLLDDE